MDQPRHHAFFSYSWADNQPFDADGAAARRADGRGASAPRTGWVSTFHDRLRKHLGRVIGRIEEGERLRIDYEQMRGDAPVEATMRCRPCSTPASKARSGTSICAAPPTSPTAGSRCR